jgi:hypothetical protein
MKKCIGRLSRAHSLTRTFVPKFEGTLQPAVHRFQESILVVRSLSEEAGHEFDRKQVEPKSYHSALRVTRRRDGSSCGFWSRAKHQTGSEIPCVTKYKHHVWNANSCNHRRIHNSVTIALKTSWPCPHRWRMVPTSKLMKSASSMMESQKYRSRPAAPHSV